jgi:hypothetical protein
MRIRTLLILLALAIGLGVWPLFPARRAARDPLGRLARLYEECRYFELRDGLSDLEADPAPDLEFFRGAVDQVFNRLEPAVRRLKGYLDAGRSGPPCMLMKEAWVLLADAYRRLGRYREAADACRQALRRFGRLLPGDERDGLLSQADLWSALADIPPQRVEVARDATVRMTKRRFPVRVADRTVLFGYDTGSNMSILFKSVADELGLALYGPPVKVQTGSGDSVDGRIGVVPELGWESIRIENAIFLVLPDDLFPAEPDRAVGGRKGLLGMPVLEALGEITETRAGDLIVTARPRPRRVQNMCFSGFMPVVEVAHRGARLRLCLDTGATATLLYPPYYRRFRGEINVRSSLRQTLLLAIGDPRTVAVRVLDEFAFRAGGMDFALRRVMVQTQETHVHSLRFHGTIGVDLIPLCSRMTMDFASMSFIAE